MKKHNMILIIGLVFLVQNSCATLNRAHGEIHYNNNISKGQELQDIKKALVDGAINQEEFNVMKEKIINDKYVKDLINKLDDEEEDDGKRKASINIGLE